MKLFNVSTSHKARFPSSQWSLALAIALLHILNIAGTCSASKTSGKVHTDQDVSIKGKRLRARIRFDYGAQCGHGWQEQYASLHAKILASEPSKQRFAVAKVHYNGLGDRLTAATTIFYFALLTRRAFRIDWQIHPTLGADPSIVLATVMAKPNVDWEFQTSDMTGEGTQQLDWGKSDGNHPPDGPDFVTFGHADLAQLWPDARTVVIQMNTGAIDKLFYNRHHRQQLFVWGLRPETAMGCALNYLFRPRPEVLDLVRDNYEVLRDPAALKIGIQLRLGDLWLRSKPRGECERHIDQDDLGRWFRCASKVEEEYRVEGKPVYWYVVSDCPALRTKAAELYGPKVLLPTREVVTEHIIHGSGNKTRDLIGFQTAFAEQWLLGMTDFQIITEDSSFGRLAALRSLRFRSVFTMRSPQSMASLGRNSSSWECQREEFDNFEQVADKHSWVIKIL